MEPNSKSPSTTTSGTTGRRKSKATGARQRCESSVSMRIPMIAADALLLDQIEPPSEVDLFGQFEELCKAYAIEPPYAARSQMELMFDVYDGRKLHQTSLDEDQYLEEPSNQIGSGKLDEEGRTSSSTRRQSVAFGANKWNNNNNNNNSKLYEHRKMRPHFSWCKLTSLVRNRKRSTIRCCLAASDTQADLCAVSLTSGGSQSNCANLLAYQTASGTNSSDFISAAFSPELDDDQEDAELKAEAIRLMGPLASQLRRSSTLSEAAFCARIDQAAAGGGGGGGGGGCGGNQTGGFSDPAQQHLVLDGAEFNQRHVSVCLFDKRCRSIQLKREAENGRHWSRLSGQLEEMRQKLTGASCIRGQGERVALSRLAERLNTIQRDAKRRKPQSSIRERIVNKEHMEQLVSLTKNSLNHLIDAQLLLRNKLSNEQQQQYQVNNVALTNKTGFIEYETLLKNNFNLLKIWQNLEETKRLACFVCEPIKANLGDLFWFSRQRAEVRATSCGQAKSCILSSPLVCLDALEVKRGLIQILEALNYLHSICKLIHRNLTPRSIQIAANDNWKLSGLEFAIRFESTAIASQEDGGGSLLGSSSGATTQSVLRRQRTLHYTKCDEFVKRPKSGLAQPELDYLAPEIWSSAKCSHKSDMFSFGLLLGQIYDLNRHKPPINCQSNVNSYESELKKLNERRKRKLGRLVPFEMRAVLIETLQSEPNLRPSAYYALQLFRRLIDLCKANEDSLRHLRRSLNHLDSCWPTAGAHNINGNSLNAHKRPRSYFRKVTCSQEQHWPPRKQTRNLHLLNLLLRGLDSLANNSANSNANNLSNRPIASDELPGQLPPPPPQQHNNFTSLKHQFEHTFESLRQLYKCSSTAAASSSSSATPKTGPLLPVHSQDSRYLMLVVAIHRRLLDQVNRMRAELPPVCRLTAANTQANRPTKNHKVLAEMEDRLHCMLARQSLVRLAPILTDPLLKLDEFILLYELVDDLLAFVGQKCRQSFSQRSRQLLTELTPVTGCPSLSSTEEDDDEESTSGQLADIGRLAGSGYLAGGGAIRQLASSQDTLNTVGLTPAKMSAHRASFAATTAEFEEQLRSQQTGINRQKQKQKQQQHQKLLQSSSRFLNHQQGGQMATKISITAPSPMGSTRDMSALIGNQDNHQQPLRRFPGSSSSASSEAHMIERMGELSMSATGYDTSQVDETDFRPSSAIQLGQANENCASDTEQVTPNEEKERSRSQLIDELLKTINDDSFNDLVDFNNKFAAQTSGGGGGGGGCSSNNNNQLTAAQMANANRPKSAMDSTQSQQTSSSSSSSYKQTINSNRNQQTSGSATANSARPSSLALGSAAATAAASGQTNTALPSTFDNVIRRMSTNFVQNFNKMSNSTLGNFEPHDSSALRREKSSQQAANSLYVDNQVPARRHSDNTINIPRIQVAPSSPAAGSRACGLNQRASVSASKLANKWKLSAKGTKRESSDKLSPNLSGALGYMRRHSSGNTTGGGANDRSGQSNGQASHSLLNASPFKTKSSSNLGIDFLLSNRSMKRRCSAASMLGHQTQRKAEDLIDAGMKSVQNMFS